MTTIDINSFHLKPFLGKGGNVNILELNESSKYYYKNLQDGYLIIRMMKIICMDEIFL